MGNDEKVFRTYKEQIDLLISRGVVIDNKDCAVRILENENYYSVINGYKDLFLTTTKLDDCYIGGTTLDEIVALYNFDRHLREILLIELLRVKNPLELESLILFRRITDMTIVSIYL